MMPTPTRTGLLITTAALCALAFLLLIPSAVASPGVTSRVSVSSTGEQANGGSGLADISADGRFVAFVSEATNLVPGDTPQDCGTGACTEIFVHDRQTGVTETVSGNARKYNMFPSISAAGRYVVFESGYSFPGGDVYVHDRATRTTDLVSVDMTGAAASAGISLAPGSSISGDGGFVVFSSSDFDIVAGDTNANLDVFVRNIADRVTERVSVDSSGVEGNGTSGSASITADGRFVAFGSDASNLVPGDTNGAIDIFVHDREAGITERVSMDSNGVEANLGADYPGAISEDGRFVVFTSSATNLVQGDDSVIGAQVFVHDRQTGATTKVSVSSEGIEGDRGAGDPDISGDGRFVVFRSESTNLAPEDNNPIPWDFFIHGLQTGRTELAIVKSYSQYPEHGDYGRVRISADGRFTVFDSVSANFVECDANNTSDVFVHNREALPQGATQPCPPAVPATPAPVPLPALPATGGQPGAPTEGGRWPVALSLSALGAASALLAGGLLRLTRR